MHCRRSTLCACDDEYLETSGQFPLYQLLGLQVFDALPTTEGYRSQHTYAQVVLSRSKVKQVRKAGASSCRYINNLNT
jgi:hypothetical protein